MAKTSLNSLSDARIFRATATGLKAGTTYYYQIVCGNMTSEKYYFTTDNKDKNITFIHMSDTQALSEEDYSVWANSVQAVTDKYNPDFLVETGDEVSTKNSEDEWRWFFSTAKERLSNLALFPTVGNHEQDSRYFAEAFQDHFTMPNTCTDSTVTPGTVYSYDYGPVHFVVLNTENVTGYDAQKAWADEDMAVTNQDYIIVMMHKGVYGGKGKNEVVFDAFASLFDKYNVPLVLFGHDHSYIRTQMKADQQDEEGTIYLQSGGSGIKHEYNNVNCSDYAEIVAEPSEPTYSVITVTASKISVKTITVATDGTISPLEGNEAVLKQDTTKTVDFSITPQVRKVTLNKSKATVKAGKKLTLTATVIPAKGKNATLTWKSSNQKVATVSKKGVVTAKKAGKTTITATTANGKKVTCVVTVKKK